VRVYKENIIDLHTPFRLGIRVHIGEAELLFSSAAEEICTDADI